MKSLGKKILNVYKSVSQISKDMELKIRGGSYKVMSESAVISAIRPALIEEGLVLVQTGATGSKDKNITSVNTRYLLIDTDSGEFVELGGYGEGSDSQDKGAGMATTYALKNTLMKTFMIISGEDADNVTSEQKTDDIKERVSKGEKKCVELITKSFNAGKLTNKERDEFLIDLNHLARDSDLPGIQHLYGKISAVSADSSRGPSMLNG